MRFQIVLSLRVRQSVDARVENYHIWTSAMQFFMLNGKIYCTLHFLLQETLRCMAYGCQRR